VLFQEVVLASSRIAATRSRSEKTVLLAELLRRLAPEEIEPAVAFLSGGPRQGRLGLGGAGLTTATGGSHAEVSSLSIRDVDDTLTRIASASGPGSAAERPRLLTALLRRATSDEADFLIRLVLGELRQGALWGIMEEALAKATEIPVDDLRRAIMLAGDARRVARAALTEGRAGLSQFRLGLFRPIQPMLAQPAKDLEDALARLGEAALEYKIDGARVQVHKAGDDVRVYSRLLNDVTVAVPEIVEGVRALPGREAILDGEVVALSRGGTPLPFQVTMRRFGRRLEVDRLRSELPLTPYFFDLVHLDGRDLVDAPARERFQALRDVARTSAVPRRVTSDPTEAAAFLEEALERGHEGIMAKATDALYEAGRRGFTWLKVKPAHTLDLVVLAAEWGHGRRKGKLSNLHLGARDPITGGFVMLGKTFKGMTDAMLEWQTRRFQEIAVVTDGYTVHLKPEIVVEVAFDDVQASPHYPGGLALRFARVKRYREDKKALEADTIESVRKIHEKSHAGMA
jgi:DNA ligase-1